MMEEWLTGEGENKHQFIAELACQSLGIRESDLMQAAPS
jgi:hypothetical protein